MKKRLQTFCLQTFSLLALFGMLGAILADIPWDPAASSRTETGMGFNLVTLGRGIPPGVDYFDVNPPATKTSGVAAINASG
jgi:hypothetical protein